MVTSIRWSQSTPTWNDGDACEFSVHELEVYIGPVGHRNDYVGYWSIREDKPKLSAAVEALSKEFNQAYDLLLAAFGNNKQITVDATQIQIEESEGDY
jgi:hypothetical protein